MFIVVGGNIKFGQELLKDEKETVFHSPMIRRGRIKYIIYVNFRLRAWERLIYSYDGEPGNDNDHMDGQQY